MGLIRTFMLACLLLLSGTLCAAAADGPYYIHGTEVNLRTEPWGEILHIFDVNEKVFIVRQEGNWSYVSAPVLELKGWVWSEYIGDGRLAIDENLQKAGDASPVQSIPARLDSPASAGIRDTLITDAEPLAVSDAVVAPVQDDEPGIPEDSIIADAVAGTQRVASGFIPDEQPEGGFEAHVPAPGSGITKDNTPTITIGSQQRSFDPPPAADPRPIPGEQSEALLITQQQHYRPAADLPTQQELTGKFYQPYQPQKQVTPEELRGVAFLPVGGYDLGLASGSRVNVREEPTTDGKILGKVNKRDKLFLIHEEDGWYFVSIPDQELKGWVSKEFILELPRVEITGDNVRLREDPNMKARVKKEVEKGSVFYQFDTKHDWRELADSVSGLRGWVHEDYIKPTERKPSRPYKVRGDAVNFRTAPDLNSQVITSFDSGTDVQVIGRTSQWTYAKQGQQQGWIFSELLQPAAWGSEGTLNISDPQKAPSMPSREYTTASSPVGRQLIEQAIAMAGVPYVWGGSSDSGVDCSGLIYKILCNDLKCGSSGMPRRASEQFAELGSAVAYEDLEPGDLVFFTTYKEGASHVGIYLGEGDFIHASSVQHKVGYSNMDDGYYRRNFVGARRLSEAQLRALQQ